MYHLPVRVFFFLFFIPFLFSPILPRRQETRKAGGSTSLCHSETQPESFIRFVETFSRFLQVHANAVDILRTTLWADEREQRKSRWPVALEKGVRLERTTVKLKKIFDNEEVEIEIKLPVPDMAAPEHWFSWTYRLGYIIILTDRVACRNGAWETVKNDILRAGKKGTQHSRAAIE